LLRLSREFDVYVTSVTVDDSDVGRINRNIQRHLQDVLGEDENRSWKNFGYFLLFPAALLVLFWFRRVWMTADQQGRYHFERSDYAKAAQLFESPLWKGISFYFNKDYQNAIQQFSHLDTAESYFNLGNAYARLGQFESALDSYARVLKRNKNYPNAEHNRKLMVKIIMQKKQQKEEEEEAQPGSLLGADEIKIADPKDQTKRPETEGDPQEIKMDMLTDEQINEMWMRRVQTSPADFLRYKFQYQLYLKEKKEDKKKKE
jgi:Ca-activated chloride channel family protein